jgi:uncharacterized protein (TIGR02246 family)
MFSALRRGDIEGVLTAYTPDARLVMVGRTAEGTEAIRGVLEFALAAGVRDVRLDEQELYMGEGFAVETGRATFLDANGVKLATNRYMTLWKQSEGRWRIHRDIGVPVAGTVSQQAAPPGPASFAIRRMEPKSVVVLPMTGSFDQHGDAIARVALGAGSCIKGPPFGRYYNSPESVSQAELKWEVGFPVTSDCKVDAPLERRGVPSETVAFAVVSGSHDAPHPWAELIKWALAQGYEVTGPATEVWLDGPKTEMRISVRKPGSE